jgi:hypothetical protein
MIYYAASAHTMQEHERHVNTYAEIKTSTASTHTH